MLPPILRDNVKKLLAVLICLTVATRIVDALARDSLAHVLCIAILSLSFVIVLPTHVDTLLSCASSVASPSSGIQHWLCVSCRGLQVLSV